MNPKEVFAAARALACACLQPQNALSGWASNCLQQPWRLDQIREAAEEAARLTPGTRYWDMNWRKGGLQQRRGELLAQEGFYNQLWCGCEFSMGHLTMRAPEDLPSYVRDFVKQLGSAKNKEGTQPASPSPVQSPIVPPNHPNV